MWQSSCVLFLATLCLAQRQQSSGERQIRLEDIERDNLAASQKPASPTPAPQHQPSVTSQQQQQQQQQLAAYQQQLLLQQLQQQYFAPSPLTYGNFGGVPLMIIHSNHLGLGSPPPVPYQAYFVPAEHPYLPPVPQYIPPRYHLNPQVPVQRVPLQEVPVAYNSVPVQQPSLQAYKSSQYPSASVVYAGTPVQTQAQAQAQAHAQAQAQAHAQAQAQQQFYNAYNALYRQQQGKDSFAAGIKSTPAPPLKPQGQVYSSQPGNSAAYSSLKNFNYNQ